VASQLLELKNTHTKTQKKKTQAQGVRLPLGFLFKKMHLQSRVP
jgi:hypothetical protein